MRPPGADTLAGAMNDRRFYVELVSNLAEDALPNEVLGVIAEGEAAGVLPRIALPAACPARDGQAVTFGTRPEHLSLAADGGIPVRVVTVEPTGADTFVACRSQGVDLAAVFRERHDFRPGSTIHLRPDIARAQLFDASTGLALRA